MQPDTESLTTLPVSSPTTPPHREIEPPLDWVEASRWEIGMQDVPYISFPERNAHLEERNRFLRSVGFPQRLFSGQ